MVKGFTFYLLTEWEDVYLHEQSGDLKKKVSCKKVNTTGRILPPFFVIRLHCYYAHGESPEHFHSHWPPCCKKNRPQFLDFWALWAHFSVFCNMTGSLLHHSQVSLNLPKFPCQILGSFACQLDKPGPTKANSLIHVTFEVQNN